MGCNSLRITATAIILFFCSMLCSQHLEKDAEVVVYMKDGSKISGKVISWKPMDTLTIKTAWGQVVDLPQYRMRKFVQLSAMEGLSTMRNYNAIEKGLYHHFQLGLISKNSNEFLSEGNGWQITASTGWQVRHWLGFGAGLGYHVYEHGGGERLVPYFAEIRGAFLRENCSPYYVLQLGYAKGLRSEKHQVTAAEGGRYISPALGMRFGAGKLKYGVELSYQLQKATFVYEDIWRPRNFEQRKSYRRICLRFSVFF